MKIVAITLLSLSLCACYDLQETARYQMVSDKDAIYRLDTKTGEILMIEPYQHLLKMDNYNRGSAVSVIPPDK